MLDYLARTLAASEREQLEAHVDECDACRALLVELARTDLDAIVSITRESDPTRIGRYEVEARLGEGGMGTVYAARDPKLDRRVAVKLVHPELAARGGVDRLLREGRALARLSHPNVVAVHDAGTDGDRVYIAMELVEGETLAVWLAKHERSWREIADKFVAVARGLAAAHRAGITHRDVKPENVLIDRDGRPKVADFGLAGHSEPVAQADSPIDPASRLTHPGAVLGTPAFMSPEQRRGEAVGPATDQYSLCAALRNALLDGESPKAVPRSLRRAIARGLATDPEHRFASIDALIDAIDPARRTRRTKRLAIAATAIVALGGGGAAYAITRSEDPSELACTAAAGEREALWTAQDRAAIGFAFVGTGVAYASETWTRVDAAASEYHRAIGTAELQLCEHRPNSDDARAAFDDGLACLGERRGELAQFAGRALHIAPADLRFAVAAVHDLSAVANCTNPTTLAAERAARATPAGAARYAQIRAARDASIAARAKGNFRESTDRARQAVELARPLGGAVLASALIAYGQECSTVDGFAPAVIAYREAVTLAEAARADDIRALAMADLMAALARSPGHEQEAIALEPLVTAAIARSGRSRAITPIVQQAMGVAQWQLGQVDEAVKSFSAALATAREELPQGDPRMPEYIYPVGLALGRLRRDAESLEYFAEAHRVAVAVWGTNHPETARYMINFATKHAALGDCKTALAELASTRALLTGVLPLDSPEHLQIAQAMGACHYMHRDYDAALREYTGRQRALVAAGRANSAEMAGTWVDVGDVHLSRNEFAIAAATYRTSVTQYEDLLGKHDPRLGFPLARLGEAELAGNHPDRAIEPLERALAIYTTAKVPAIMAADVTSPLSRALWSRPADRVRARQLAKTVMATYAAGGPAYAERKVAVEKWLATH
ncbi:MAG: tetratricopeptide repeat protein [Kofleriaceae bacterium]